MYLRFLTLSWPEVYMSHLQTFQVLWDTSIPLLHPAIYLELSLLRETDTMHFNANSRVQMLLCAMLRGWLLYYIECTSVR